MSAIKTQFDVDLCRRILVEENNGHWRAWFAGSPEVTFNGDTPTAAVDRLWQMRVLAEQAAGGCEATANC